MSWEMQLLSVTDRSMADVNGVQEKLDRKKKVESTNENLDVQFCNGLKEKLVTIDQEFHTFAEDQIHFLQGLYTQLGERLEIRTAELKALEEWFSSMVGNQMCLCEEWSKSENIHLEHSNGWIAEHCKISGEFKDTISRQQIFESDKFHPVIGTIVEYLHNQAEQLSNTRMMIAAKISEREEKLREFVSSYKHKISEMESFVSSTANKQMAVLENTLKHLSDINEAEDLLIAKIRSMLESLESVLQSRESIKKNTQKQLEKSLSESVLQEEMHQEVTRLTTEINNDIDIYQS